MRYTSILGLSILAVTANAQITIGPADLPSAGQQHVYWNAAANGLDVSGTGAAYTWDFSLLDPMASDTDVTVTVGSTPLLYQFFFNNPILYPDHDADFAMEGTGFNFQVLNVEDVFDYYKKSSAGYRNVGFGANMNGIPSSVRRIPVDWIYRFPLDFGDVDSSFSTWEMNVPNTFFFRQEQWRHNTVDGWGTLVLPTATFDVLRVRSVLNRHDSIHISQFGQGFAIDEPETVEYKWLAQGMGRPVLTIITVAGVPTVAQFYYDPISTIDESQPLNFTVHPNPAYDRVIVEISGSEPGTLMIRDLRGTIVRDHQFVQPGLHPISVSDLSNGAYIIEFRGSERSWQQRLVVTH